MLDGFDLKLQLFEIKGFLDKKIAEETKEFQNLKTLSEEYKNALEI